MIKLCVNKIATVLLLMCFVGLAQAESQPTSGNDKTENLQIQGYKELEWEDLMPPGWEPEPVVENHEFAGVQIPDAPVVLELNKQKVKLPGFMLPIKQTMKGVTEFLLVPFLGACIHVPPPPGNQMVYVRLKKPYPAEGLYEPIWVKGMMSIENMETEYAMSSYSMNAASAEEYIWE